MNDIASGSWRPGYWRTFSNGSGLNTSDLIYFPDIASELWIKYTCICTKTSYVRLASQEFDKLGICSASILRALSMLSLSAGVEVTYSHKQYKSMFHRISKYAFSLSWPARINHEPYLSLWWIHISFSRLTQLADSQSFVALGISPNNGKWK